MVFMLRNKKGKLFIFISVLITFIFVKFMFVQAGLYDVTKNIFHELRSEIHYTQFFFIYPEIQKVDFEASPFLFIAHGTGSVSGKNSNNSVEGLNVSFEKGCRYMEADFVWTADSHLVSSHDWNSFFGDHLIAIPDYNSFKQRRRSDGLTQMTFEDFDVWLLGHPTAKLVTDVKANNLKALIFFRNARSFKQIIPQVYSFMEFGEAKKMGFDQIILTTYSTDYSVSSLRRFAERAHPFAITVPVKRLSLELISGLTALDTPVLTHPVNLRSDLEKLPKGISGVYSSTLCQ